MKRIAQVWLTATVLAVSSARAQAPISPAQLEVNLGGFQVDRYDGTTTNNGAIDDDKNCGYGSVYRECVRHILSNYDGLGVGGDYNSQGVIGVAIQLGMAGGPLGSGGAGSTPFSDISGAVNQKWLDNLYLFFQDLRYANIQNVTLRLNMAGGWAGSETMAYTQYCTFETPNPDGSRSPGTGPVQPCNLAPPDKVPVQLVCYPWLPWCNINTSGVEQCYNCTDPSGYNNNPYLPQSLGAWSWDTYPQNPFEVWFGKVLQRAQWAKVNIREVDLVGETQLSQAPVLARMIYSNVNTVPSGNPTTPDTLQPGPILAELSAVMAEDYGFASGAVILSSLSWNPLYSQTCNSGVWEGDSALMLDVSELFGAEVGWGFGVIDNYDNTVDGLVCGWGFQAIQYLPYPPYIPTVIDIHAYPADEVRYQNNPSFPWIANPNDPAVQNYSYPDYSDPNDPSGSTQSAATNEYSAMVGFAQSHRVWYNSAPTIVIGETDTNSPDQFEGEMAPNSDWGPPDGYWHRPNTPKAASENALGFHNSGLLTQTAASVVIRPFDPMGFDSQVRTPAALGPPTGGPYEAGPCTYTVWQYWTVSADTTGLSYPISTAGNCQWSVAPPTPGPIIATG